MKKLAALTAAACILGSFPASARIDIGLNIGVPVAEPAYVVAEPVPAYAVAPAYPAYYQHRHYWHGRRDFHHR